MSCPTTYRSSARSRQVGPSQARRSGVQLRQESSYEHDPRPFDQILEATAGAEALWMIGDSVDADVTGAASVDILPYSSADSIMASSVVVKISPGFFIHRREMTWITPPQGRRRARSAGHAPTQMERMRSSLGQPPHEAWQAGGCELFGRGLKLLYRPQEQATKHPRLPGSEDTGSQLEDGHAREMT